MSSKHSNYISKQKYYKEYTFPRSMKDKIIIQASPSGIGFKTFYDPVWVDILSSKDFNTEIAQV
jgi:hypothetical protein